MARPQIPPHVIRKMKVEDIEKVMDIWKELGLEEATHSVHTWLQVDPDGFYVAVDDDKGILYGMCCGVISRDDFAFIGMYAVRQEYQGLGIGLKMWKTMMKHVGDRNAGLNAVPEHLHTYRDRAGFSIMEDWNTVIFSSSSADPSKLTPSLPKVQIVPVDDSILDRLIDFDATVHGYRREKIVPIAVKEGDTTCFAALRDDLVCGYGSFHRNIFGNVMVGPLYAEDAEIAEVLMRKLIETSPLAQERGLTLMVLDCNRGAMDIVDKLGMKRVEVLPRCYRKRKLHVDFEKIFVHHSLNFAPF